MLMIHSFVLGRKNAMLAVRNLSKRAIVLPSGISPVSTRNSARSLPTLMPARSWLFPTKTRQGLAKASRTKADMIVLDLEDSVPLHLKAKMREEYLQVLRDGLFKGSKIFIRLNEIGDYEEVVKDIKHLTIPGVSGFLLPKVNNCSSLKAYEELVTAAERDNDLVMGSLKFVPLLETASAFFEAEQIAKGSSRNVGLIAGSEDFMADSLCAEHSSTYYAHLSQVSIASRAAQIQPIAGVCDKIDDHIASEKFYRKMKACGFAGAVTLTPSQTLQANITFSYSPKEIQWAERVMSVDGLSTIQPSVQESRQMIGPPHRLKASVIRQQNKQIQRMATPSSSQPRLLRGHTLPRGLQETVSVGQSLQSPLEITVTESWRALWECSFLTINRLATSAELASKLGLQSIPFPFTLLNTLALALTVTCFSESARVHLGCYDAVQNGAVYPGDTIRCMYRIDDARPMQSKGGSCYTVTMSSHRLVNQQGKVVFTVQKRTMFPPMTIERPEQDPKDDIPKVSTSDWHRFIISQPTALLSPLSRQPLLSAGDLIIHGDYKSFGLSETRMMCKLFKITNAHHHNNIRYSSSDILVPGPFVIAAMLSNTESDVGDVVCEEFPVHTNINKVNPGDQIGTLTYVVSTRQLAENPELEEITLKHIGVKNIDLEWLLKSGVPEDLFSDELSKPAQYEMLCAAQCPLLYRKIACQAVRKIIRVSSAACDRYRKEHKLV